MWIQTSGEYPAAARQAFEIAQIKLTEALEDKNWTAATEQESIDVSHLNPAIIVDVDETVLDNSPFGARLIEKNKNWDSQMWKEWVREERAAAIPGAVEFLKYVREKHVEIFYITNRSAELEEETKTNLKKLGFPLDETSDHVFTKRERSEWGSDKSSRRKVVAESHRILLLVGDDLNDFVSATTLDSVERTRISKKFESYWGSKWIILPNPIYGGWESSLFAGHPDYLDDSNALKLKYKKLKSSPNGNGN